MNATTRRHAQLPLFSQNGRWLMRFRGKRAEFASRAEALRAAILEAFEHSRNGTPTQVICIDDHLAIEIAWTYGVDPDPPSSLPDEPPASARRPIRRHAAPHPAVPRSRAMRGVEPVGAAAQPAATPGRR
jgi:hypothetical protein